MLIALGVIVAFKCKVINLGADGQVSIGAMAATWVVITFNEGPAVVVLLISILFSFLVAALWASIVGIMKVKLGVSEIVSSLMMNYVAFISWITC